jgi:hypothetical protein
MSQNAAKADVSQWIKIAQFKSLTHVPKSKNLRFKHPTSSERFFRNAGGSRR